MEKYALLSQQLLYEGIATASNFHTPEVFTFPMHAQANYPFEKEQSDKDIALPNGTDDKTYLDILCSTLPQLIEAHQPDFVFYQAGVDVLATDKLGELSLTVEGCGERDRLVFETCHRYHLPVQCSMGGGYSPQLTSILRAHTQTFAIVSGIYN